MLFICVGKMMIISNHDRLSLTQRKWAEGGKDHMHLPHTAHLGPNINTGLTLSKYQQKIYLPILEMRKFHFSKLK